MYTPVKLGLSNMQRMLGFLERERGEGEGAREEGHWGMVHVAGTNGKGSVSYKLATILQLRRHGHGGVRRPVGLFVSPHISSLCERVQVDRAPLRPRTMARLIQKTLHLCRDQQIPATFFEVITGVAWQAFTEARCRAVVMEVGLGGRLDASNALRAGAVSIITSIGLEHTHILGDTVEEIAAEKAGIVKPGVPVVVGATVPFDVVRARAKDVGAPFVIQDLTPVASNVQHSNARIAGVALRLLEAARDLHAEAADQSPAALLRRAGFDNNKTSTNVRWVVTSSSVAPHVYEQAATMLPGRLSAWDIADGLGATPPCRFEQLDVHMPPRTGAEANTAGGDAHATTCVRVVLDVGHNPDAVRGLVQCMQSTFSGRSFRVVFGAARDKNHHEILEALLALCEGDPTRIHFIKASHPRSTAVEALDDVLRDVLQTTATSTSASSARTANARDAIPSGERRGCIQDTVRHVLHMATTPSSGDNNVVHTESAAPLHCQPTQNASVLDSQSASDVVLVCGSLFFMCDVREALGIDELRDDPSVQAAYGAHLRPKPDDQEATSAATALDKA